MKINSRPILAYERRRDAKIRTQNKIFLAALTGATNAVIIHGWYKNMTEKCKTTNDYAEAATRYAGKIQEVIMS